MAGIHQISSSKFIQSGSVAHFKNGITSSLSLSSSGAIYSNEFVGMSTETSNESNNVLNVGKALGMIQFFLCVQVVWVQSFSFIKIRGGFY